MSLSPSPKHCFNSKCNRILFCTKRGWRRRTGDFADLCDTCAAAYEEGKFCELFHSNDSGWRGCQSCGKQIHCGCIVSYRMLVVLDAGGIECIDCTRKTFVLTPNPAWLPPSHVLHGMPNTSKDMSVKQWNSIAASGVVPWRQAPGLFNSEMHQKMPFELDIPSSADQLNARERLCPTSLDKKKNEDSSERFINGSLKIGASLLFEKGIKSEEQPNPNLNATQSPFLNTVPVTPYFNLNLNPALTNETSMQTEVCKRHTQWTTPPLAAGKKCCSFSGDDSSCEAQTRNGRLQGDTQGQSHLLPRDWPRINIEEQKPGISNSIITPLFEKLLTASDAGRIGRLILPKKCAEVYFPPISNPEGIPLLIQHSEGKEWVCQFRFWPNNKSKIYFLEGVHLCMQSMQMQAGDRATFSRLEPGGKLVMGCRKALSSSDKCKLSIVNTNNGGSTHNYAIIKTTEAGEVVSVYNHAQGNPAASGILAVKKQDSADPTGMLSKVDKSSYTATELLGTKPIIGNKRKYSTLASKSKCRQMENEMVELKVTLEQAQVLFRPPNNAPKIMMIEGYEIEEFEEPPIIGRPTILAEDHMGEKIQWAKCEDCFKWRKLPGEVFFPSRWTCSNNLWDPQRSHCSVAQEISSEKLKDLLSVSNEAGVKKLEVYNEELISLVALEGLDALSYLGIKEEGEAIPPSSLAATKHPRHRPGCSCIVCNQPPSGTGPKHKPTCTCNICLTVKRGLETQLLRREKKQSENEAETAHQKIQYSAQFVDEKIRPCGDAGTSSSSDKMMTNEGHDNDPINMNSYTSPFKGQIDLNIQPEPDEDLSPVSDSGGMIKNAIEDAARSHTNMLEKISNSAGETTSTGIKLHPLKASFRSSVDQHQLEYPLDSKER